VKFCKIAFSFVNFLMLRGISELPVQVGKKISLGLKGRPEELTGLAPAPLQSPQGEWVSLCVFA
jgi:hypothetical protein